MFKRIFGVLYLIIPLTSAYAGSEMLGGERCGTGSAMTALYAKNPLALQEAKAFNDDLINNYSFYAK